MVGEGLEPVAMTLGPLHGVTVVDFTQVFMGPSCTQMLGDYGAEVIKIERPGDGDLSRTSIADPAGPDNPIFLSINRNKRSVLADLRDPAAHARVLELIAGADVVVSNFRPGVMERLGFGYDDVRAVNPRVIWAAGSGFGSRGPLAGQGGQDVIAQAYSGVLGRSAGPDGTLNIYTTSLCDDPTGMHLAQGVLMALYHRERSGQGQRIEVNMLDSMLHMQMQEAAMELNRGYEINWATMPLTGVFHTTDSPICVVGAFKQDALSRICRALGLARDLASDERFDTRTKMDERREELHAIFAEVIATDTAATWLDRFEREGVLCAPIRTLPGALNDEQSRVNASVIDMDHPALGRIRTVKAPIEMSSTPATYRLPPPRLGEHTEQVMGAAFRPAARRVAVRESQ
jgi:formyl-CoA transferase